MKKKVFIISVLVLIAVIAVILLIVYTHGISEYRKNFGVRGPESTGFLDYFFSNNPGLKHEPFECTSNRGTAIRGVRLLPDSDPKGLIVMTHPSDFFVCFLIVIRIVDASFVPLNSHIFIITVNAPLISLRIYPQHIFS